MKPKVSVIIPVYNCEAYIGEAIESVLHQSFQGYEIIVVDDGSDDRSAEIAASYPDVRLIQLSHEGVAAARNCGIREAKADLIAFLDADDCFTKDKLALQLTYMLEHPECAIVFSEYSNYSDVSEGKMTERQKAMMRSCVPQCLPTACIRKDVFDFVGLFDTSYPHGEDTEFFLRLRINEVDMSHKIGAVLYLRRIHDNNITLQHEDAGRKEVLKIFSDIVRKRRMQSNKT